MGVRLCMFVCMGAPYVHNLCLCGFNLINKKMFRGKFLLGKQGKKVVLLILHLLGAADKRTANNTPFVLSVHLKRSRFRVFKSVFPTDRY